MRKLFFNPILERHKDVVDKDNCRSAQAFELLLLFCSLGLYASSYAVDDYVSMRTFYLIYASSCVVLYLATRFYVDKHLEYARIAVIVVMLNSYLFCVFSGILYNINGPSVTVYAMMVAACTAFMMPFAFVVIFHSTVAVIYCIIALNMKPLYGAGDAVNYVFFLIMSLLLTSIVYRTRLNYLSSLDDAIEQKNIAEQNAKLERALRVTEEASQAKSKFLSRMSHEIRTPINAIVGIAELERQDAESGTIDKNTVLTYADETTNAAKYLLSLVNDILDSAKIESDKVEIQQVPIHAETFLMTVMTLAKPMAEAREINFEVERKSYLHQNYVGDSVRVQQIIMNLLSNAFKFTAPGGNVKLTAEAIAETEHTTTMQFTVEDDGIGMSDEFQKKLFQQFAQEQDSNTSKFEGSGLGLHISKELAKKMGGDLVCHSEKGKGTTFTATVVVRNTTEEEDESLRAKLETPQIQEEDFAGMRILLCEDHPLNQRITRSLLERKNCVVEIAEDGVIGVDKFAKSAVGYYKLILMDIRMPNMDGLDAARTIREMERADAKEIPIVAMSANTYAEDIQKSLDAGMNAHLAKPVDAAELYQTIGQYSYT